MFRATFPHGASRRLIAAFVLLLLLPAVAVVWLGVRLIVQDRQLESENLRKQRERVAERIVDRLNERLSASERNLGSDAAPADDAVILVLGPDGVETRGAIGLLFSPGLAAVSSDLLLEFAPGEEMEHLRQDFEAAEAAYRQLAVHRVPAVRAGALVRLARVLRKKRSPERSLGVYDDLARLGDTLVDGIPAELAARRARCLVLEDLKQAETLRQEAIALRDGLLAGTWKIDRGTFTQYQEEVAAWLGSPAAPRPAQLAAAEAAEWLWERRGTAGRTALRLSGIDLALLWQSSGETTRALVAGPEFQEREWFSAIRTEADSGVLVTLSSTAGSVFGAAIGTPDATTLSHSAAQSGLPWDVMVKTASILPIGSNRRLAIIAGLGFLILLVIAGGYVMARAVSRELAVARLQSDFVASVSHEFRTPLTSLRQFTDLLNEAEDLPPDKRRGFYAAQARATDRLQRLVESLLDFKRMEAGTHPYQRRRLAASTLVESVVNDFRREAAAGSFDIEYARTGDHERTIDADPEAMSLALWNLLDNAVKYSGDSRRVSVALAGRNGSVEISVRDRGLGVPHEEQQEIFRQFVRGRDARARGIKGTGIGLAMVQHIVRGHGGRVALESAPGEGSTFTIVLPAGRESA